MKNTKILATYGPAIASADTIRRLVQEGVNLFRINCSHGATDDFLSAAKTIREGTARAPYPVGLLFDISGPKLRLGRFEGTIQLDSETQLTLTSDRTDLTRNRVKVNHPAVIKSLGVGDWLYMDDGQFLFEVTAAENDTVTVKSHSTGDLTGGKGINLPGIKLPIPTIGTKDSQDIKTAVEAGADYIALSFVRSAEDLKEARHLIQTAGGAQRLIAKLEKREAIDQLEDIMRLSDGVMIARGDLGVEMPPEELPRLQRRIIRLGNRYHKPVIVATQMLESMRFAPRPTRAEVNDVASAVLDFVDAVMLSAETASGDYPVEAVRIMARVIEATEQGATPPPDISRHPEEDNEIPQAIADAVSYTRERGTAEVIFAYTYSGYTAQLISNLFSSNPIIALTPRKSVMSALSLYRSVYPVRVEQPSSFTDMLETVDRVGLEEEVVRRGDNVIITGGAPFGKTTATNFMLIHNVGSAITSE